MPNDTAHVLIEYTPEFKRNVRALAKKYRHIRSDVDPVLNQLAVGEILGDQVTGTRYAIFKVRIKNSDIRKGKRAGYRLIYHLKTPRHIILVTIYSKTEQSDISADQIRRIVNEFDLA